MNDQYRAVAVQYLPCRVWVCIILSGHSLKRQLLSLAQPNESFRHPTHPTQQRLRVLVRELNCSGSHETCHHRQPLRYVPAAENISDFGFAQQPLALLAAGCPREECQSQERLCSIVQLVRGQVIYVLAKRYLRAVIGSPCPKHPRRVNCSVVIQKYRQSTPAQEKRVNG